MAKCKCTVDSLPDISKLSEEDLINTSMTLARCVVCADNELLILDKMGVYFESKGDAEELIQSILNRANLMQKKMNKIRDYLLKCKKELEKFMPPEVLAMCREVEKQRELVSKAALN